MAWVEQTPFGAFGPPPQLHGGDVGGIAAALLRQRMAQQEQPLEVAKLMQQARQQQLANALAQQKLAIEQQQANTVAELYKHHGNYYDAMADRANQEPFAAENDTGLDTQYDPNTQQWFRKAVGAKGRVNYYPIPPGSPNMPNQSTYDLLLKQMSNLRDWASEERKQNISDKKANVPFSRADEMAQIQAQLDAMTKGAQSPATAQPTQSNPPATSGIAPSRDEAQVGGYYRAPDGSVRQRTN